MSKCPIFLTVTCLAVAGVLSAPGTPVADELRIEQGERGQSRRDEPRRYPSRGMTMENVENVFGSPAEKIGPVGDPPITRWKFGSFTVYFEHNLVLHTVVHGEPPRRR